ncbi:MAG: radical SAM family heme chaperone HemW [Steroidobacteraceae bacterium]
MTASTAAKPDATPLALYAHFPWCVAKCPYCDFNSFALRGELPVETYLEALRRDLDAQLEWFAQAAPAALPLPARPVTSVFLGGGTPSLFAPDAIGRWLEVARARLPFAPDCEITLEANPGTIERGRFADYRAAGVNRVSLGAQSFGSAQLAALGRIHGAADTRVAAAELHAAGLTNFNLDLMYGLPGQTPAMACADVLAALELEPAHLSHYQLTLEPGTTFAGRPPDALPDDDSVERMLAECLAVFDAHGFARYEVSAHARPGARCRHNLTYWHFGDYLGVGAGAHGKLTLPAAAGPPRILRTTRPREPRRYGADPVTLQVTEVPLAQRPFEFLLNALRLVDGYEIADFTTATGLSWDSLGPTTRLLERGLLVTEGGRVRATQRGLQFLNELLIEYLPDPLAAVPTSPWPTIT